MADLFRSPTELEKLIIQRLFSVDFPGVEQLRDQLAGLEVRNIGSDNCLELKVVNGAPASCGIGIPVEASYPNQDEQNEHDPKTHILLHVGSDGFMNELEFYSDENSPISLPNIEKLHIQANLPYEYHAQNVPTQAVQRPREFEIIIRLLADQIIFETTHKSIKKIHEFGTWLTEGFYLTLVLERQQNVKGPVQKSIAITISLGEFTQEIPARLLILPENNTKIFDTLVIGPIPADSVLLNRHPFLNITVKVEGQTANQQIPLV